MYDHELSVVLQQERERAIREARLHHRYDVAPGPSLRQRLMSAFGRLLAGQRPTADQARTSPSTASAAGQVTGCGTHGATSRSVPG